MRFKTTFPGILLGVVVTFASIAISSSLRASFDFLSLSSALTVLGGLLASILISFPSKDLRGLIGAIKLSIYGNTFPMEQTLKDLVNFSTAVKRGTLLDIDSDVQAIQEPFLKKGLTLAIDRAEEGQLREILLTEIRGLEERHLRIRKVLDRAGSLAPAWGMIGTVIGLILMLKNLNDFSTLGPSMALALITTFYGAYLAYGLFIPLSNRLRQMTSDEVYYRQAVVEGVIAIYNGENPKVLEQRLEAYLPPVERQSSFSSRRLIQ